MKQIFLMVNDGTIKTIETPAPSAKENTVIVETMYSVISVGTERVLSSFGGKNLLQKIAERPDQASQVVNKMLTDGIITGLEAAFGKLNEPMPIGYSGVGRVVQCGTGVTDIKPGDLVAMAGTAYHSEVNRVGRNLVVKLPERFPDVRQAAFCALGGIALQGIHQAGVVPGETVGVVGLGLVGHIVARILSAYGCDVIAYDISDKSLPGTRLKAFLQSTGENVEEATKALTGNHGVDRVIITASTNSNAPMDLAVSILRDRGTICMVGVTQMNIDRRPFYKKELTFTIARSYGPGRYDANYEEKGVDLPVGYVRFTEGRNLEEFVRLVDTGRLDLSELITHEIPFENAADAYEMITVNARNVRYIGILLKYGQDARKWAPRIERPAPAQRMKPGQSVTVGIIGAGGFVRSTVLPLMKADGHFVFRALATTGGVNAPQADSIQPFSYITGDYADLLRDPKIDLIAVCTNHNSHAKFIVEALEAGKHVYCEKPLCLTLEELDRIEAARQKAPGELFCGLNRRFAPLIQEVRQKLATDRIPAMYDYIMNAGYVPEDHWTQDEKVGGGRIRGEACHIIDLIQYLDGSELRELRLSFLENQAYPKRDNALITLRFLSGAVANIVYSSMGSKKYPKEQLRVLTKGSVLEMNNFISLKAYGRVHVRKIKLRQDKGIRQEYEYMREVLSGTRENTAIQDAMVGTRLLLEAFARGS